MDPLKHLELRKETHVQTVKTRHHSFFPSRYAMRGGFALCLALLVFLGISFEGPVAHAASSPADPLVIIDADITHLSGPCIETFQINIGTPSASLTRIPCPDGTIRASEIVRRSQALRQHEPYVLYPSPQASLAEKQQAWQQFQHLVSAEIASQQQKLIQARLHPLTSCGQNGFASRLWYVNGDSFYSTIGWYRSVDCRVFELDTATNANAYHNPNKNIDWYWPFDKYAGATYNVPGCPDITYYGGASHGIDQTIKPGYTYENWIGDWTACYWWLFPSYFHNDIGPIN